jgi:hypothetical protein
MRANASQVKVGGRNGIGAEQSEERGRAQFVRAYPGVPPLQEIWTASSQTSGTEQEPSGEILDNGIAYQEPAIP